MKAGSHTQAGTATFAYDYANEAGANVIGKRGMMVNFAAVELIICIIISTSSSRPAMKLIYRRLLRNITLAVR